MKQFKTFKKTTVGWKPQSESSAGLGKTAEDASKEELRSELKKHEERETPAQEKAESAKEQEIERKAGVETKHAHDLDAAERNAIPSGEFAEPEKRKYPIEDRAHAANAKARVSQHGTPAEKAKVDAAVERKYPDMGEKKAADAKALKALASKVIKKEHPTSMIMAAQRAQKAGMKKKADDPQTAGAAMQNSMVNAFEGKPSPSTASAPSMSLGATITDQINKLRGG
jgi:hypothetical protein